MASLRRELRKELWKAVIAARDAGEKGARKAIEELAVQNAKPWPTMSEEQKQLRNRLRAHGRQLGDLRNHRNGDQSIEHLVQECAYEHWHRMLFARFLAESNLLIEPESGVAISLDECRELAFERGVDWLTLAREFAVKMLSQIFRARDPVLEVSLPLETRQELEGLLKSLPSEVFLADDSLGWVYQFWQTEKKKEVNQSGEKIGADELASVTQLFTEDYMVLFLLHNTLGAWWAGKILAGQSELATTAKSEEELRAACAIGDLNWQYLRFVREGDEPWRPAAGTFDGWPQDAKELRILDPCMGSGHFLVFALPTLVALRIAEEKLDREDAIEAVLSDNLFGLELDNRCTQIAAFNLAITAWRMIGYRPLPPMNLACSGLGINAKEEEWVELAGNDQRMRDGMSELYQLFKKGPILGSLINPRVLNRPSPLHIADFHAIQPLLETALRREEREDYEAAEMAIAAQGMAKAAEILIDQFTLVATNIPYLGRGKQDDELKDYCERVHPDAKADLATCFIERCISFSGRLASVALVTPQSWLTQDKYHPCRERFLRLHRWLLAVQLGPGAFKAISGEVVKPLLFVCETESPSSRDAFIGMDVTSSATAEEKQASLLVSSTILLQQLSQLLNPNGRVSFDVSTHEKRLSDFAFYSNGIQTGDLPHFSICFWEVDAVNNGWAFQQTTVDSTLEYGGMTHALWWQDGRGDLAAFVREKLNSENTGAWLRGKNVWGKRGVLVSAMGSLHASLYLGDLFDDNTVAIIPTNEAQWSAIWAAVSDPSFHDEVRKIDKKLNVRGPLVEIPFDLGRWQRVAAEKFPHGLPKPFSNDPAAWLFNGHPKSSYNPLQVAVARLLGYKWPRQMGSSFPDCPPLIADGLESFASKDGIVCLEALLGEASAADRLRSLLANAYTGEWSPLKQAELLTQVDATSLDQWLRDKFFEQHCFIFHNRPFVWHIWDGLMNGFHAFVNYHRLAAPNGQGRRTLEKLIYSYLGDWIKQQRNDQRDGIEGADARVAAAEHLKKQLELILHGDPPYDIFVRWKALPEQPIGWDPDINDGVRQNIRPFVTATPLNVRSSNACLLRVMPRSIQKERDRGKEPYREKQDFPWFWTWNQSGTVDFLGGENFDGNRWNDLHYSPKFKQSSRERNSLLKKAQKK